MIFRCGCGCLRYGYGALRFRCGSIAVRLRFYCGECAVSVEFSGASLGDEWSYGVKCGEISLSTDMYPVNMHQRIGERSAR